MHLTTWLLYVAAVFVLTVTPGPCVFMCVSNSVQFGARRAFLSAFGSTCAIVGIMSLSVLGLGAVLATSAILFAVLKWLGAAYLAYLGLSALLSKAEFVDAPAVAPAGGPGRIFMRGFLVGASNPKAVLFFTALFPQFIEPSAPHLPQFLILGLTFVCFELFWLSVYIVSATRARRWLQQPGRATVFSRATGLVFLTAAGLLAVSKRNAA